MEDITAATSPESDVTVPVLENLCTQAGHVDPSELQADNERRKGEHKRLFEEGVKNLVAKKNCQLITKKDKAAIIVIGND